MAIFNINEENLNWKYSIGLLVALPLLFPISYYLNGKTNYHVMAMANLTNAVAAWLRYGAVATANFPFALMSTAMLAFPAAVLLASACHLAEEAGFAPAERQRATSLVVQAGYGGWCLGEPAL